MAFPSNPAHLAPALVNGVNYVYDSSTVSWSPQSSTNTLTIGSLATFSVSGNASVLGTFGIGTASPTQALSVNGSIGGTILYDYNDTGYYVDPNVTSNMYTAIFRNTAYSYGWWRSYNQTGWYNETYAGGVWMTESIYVRVYNGKSFLVESAAHMRIGAGEANEKQLWFSNDSGLIYFFQQTVANGGGFGLWDSTGGKTRWYTDTAGNFSNSYSIRAPIFYDTDNTNYYLNPAGYSVLAEIPVGNNGAATYDGISDMNSLTQKSGWYLYNTPSNGPFATWTTWMTTMGHYSGDRYGFQLAKNYWGDDFRVRGVTNNTWQTWRKLPLYDVNSSGTLYATDFIDNNDTAYHCDPSSWSRMANINVSTYQSQDNWWLDGNGNQRMLWVSADHNYYKTNNYHVFRRMDNTDLHYIASDGNVWMGTYKDWLSTQIRSAIFYDHNDTYYKIDPNGISQLSQVLANNWFRAQGQTGLYSESYGCHIYPTTDGRLWQMTTPDSTSGGLILRKSYEGEVRGYLYWDGSENFGLLHKNGGWNYRGWTDGCEIYGYWHYQTRIQAYIYYDREDTGYYCDPAYWTNFLNLRHNGNTAYFRNGVGVDQCCGADGAISLGGNGSRPPSIAWHSGGVMEGQCQGQADGWRKIYFYDHQGAGLGIHCTGIIASNTEIYSYYSDRRLKEDFVRMTDHWDVLNGLKGYRFTWNELSGEISGFNDKVGTREVGLIAQDVLAVYPEAVVDRTEGPEDDRYKTIKHDRFVPVFVEALNDLKAQLDQLKLENQQLREMINDRN